MTDSWLVALDIDGTILTDDYRILPAVREAVAAARDSGVKVALATARAPAAVRHVLEDLGEVDGIVCCGGALILVQGKESWEIDPRAKPRLLAPQQVSAIAASAAELGVSVAAYGLESAFVQQLDDLLEREFRLTSMTWSEGDLATLREPIVKMLALVRPGERHRLETLQRRFEAELSCVFSHTNLLEVMAPGTNKGLGIALLRDASRIAANRVVAIGDSPNDVAMFREAAVAIAMGNAGAEVRAAADWVTASNAEAGVAAALLRCARELWG